LDSHRSLSPPEPLGLALLALWFALGTVIFYRIERLPLFGGWLFPPMANSRGYNAPLPQVGIR